MNRRTYCNDGLFFGGCKTEKTLIDFYNTDQIDVHRFYQCKAVKSVSSVFRCPKTNCEWRFIGRSRTRYPYSIARQHYFLWQLCHKQ